MLRKITKKKTLIKRRKNSSKEDDRKRQLNEFLATKGVTKIPYNRGGDSPLKKPPTGTRLRERENCQLCGSWTDEAGEYRHYDWCPTYKKSRKNPIKSIRTNKFSPLVDLNLGKTSKSNVVLNYEDREVVFTGQDASDIRDIIKYQLKLFRGSSKLQREYPGNEFNGGGFYIYLTEVLKDIYPKYFK